MKLVESRKKSCSTEKETLWDLVYDELSADAAHHASNRKISRSEFPNAKRFRFDDEIEFDKNDGIHNSNNHKDRRNAWPTDDGFKLKPNSIEQEDFAYLVADTYGCKMEPSGEYVYMCVPALEVKLLDESGLKSNGMIALVIQDIINCYDVDTHSSMFNPNNRLVIHHLDNDHYNNLLSNLIFMTNANHNRYSGHTSHLKHKDTMTVEDWRRDFESYCYREKIDYIVLTDLFDNILK